MLILLIISIALLHAAPINTADEMLSALVRETYPERVQLTAQQITDLLVQHYKQIETFHDQPKALKMTGERTGDINLMTVNGVSGSNNVFINGNNNAVTNNNYYVQIGSDAADLDHLITLIMTLTQQDETTDDVAQMVNDVLDIAREHVPEEPEETFVLFTTEIPTSVQTTTTSELKTTTATSSSTTLETLVTSTTSTSTSSSARYTYWAYRML